LPAVLLSLPIASLTFHSDSESQQSILSISIAASYRVEWQFSEVDFPPQATNKYDGRRRKESLHGDGWGLFIFIEKENPSVIR
jgi:hypothetical protein